MSHALTGFDESVFRQLTLLLEISLMKQNDPNWKIPKELFDFFYQVRDHGHRNCVMILSLHCGITPQIHVVT